MRAVRRTHGHAREQRDACTLDVDHRLLCQLTIHVVVTATSLTHKHDTSPMRTLDI